jgi:L-alanine-DL-glutamate epimerase-like enolase superfamily enzyme
MSPHLLGSINHGTYVECFLPERDPVFWNLITNRGEIKDGRYPVPQGAGLGLALDDSFIAKYLS